MKNVSSKSDMDSILEKCPWLDRPLNSKHERLDYLKSFCQNLNLDSDPTLLPKGINNSTPTSFHSIINNEKLEQETINSLLEVLSSDKLIRPHKTVINLTNNIFASVVDSPLITSNMNLNTHINDLFEELDDLDFGINPYLVQIQNIVTLLNCLFEKFPKEYNTLSTCIDTLYNKVISGIFKAKLSRSLELAITDMHEIYKYSKNQEKQKEIAKLQLSAQKNQFNDNKDYGMPYKSLTILPSVNELLNPPNIFFRPILSKGAYPSVPIYLETHFKLLREDMIQPLRYGIQLLRKGDSEALKELYMYNNVRLNKIDCDRNDGILYEISFAPYMVRDPDRIKWDRSQRLKHGTLLCVTPMNEAGKPTFEYILWAEVVSRKQTEQGKIAFIKFEKGFEAAFTYHTKYFMLESREVYYEAYSHTLSILKAMDPISLPFSELLICKTNTCKAPNYITNETKLDLSCLYPKNSKEKHTLRVLGDWPVCSELDESQEAALKLAFSQEIALIQGPPGTGKTYVGSMAIKILLKAKKQIQKLRYHEDHNWTEEELLLKETLCETPILVITYTNHALDQFLENLLSFENDIIRIGSRSENDLLKERTLTEKRKQIHELKRSGHSIPLEIRSKNQSIAPIYSEMDDLQTKIIHKLRLPIDYYIFTESDFKTAQSPLIYSNKLYNMTFKDTFNAWIEGKSLNHLLNLQLLDRFGNRKRANLTSKTHNTKFSRNDNFDYELESDDNFGIEFECNKSKIQSIHNIDNWSNHSSDDYQSINDSDSADYSPPEYDPVIQDENIWNLSRDERIQLYKYWSYFSNRKISNKYLKLFNSRKSLLTDIDHYLVKNASLVGMTTSCAAKNSELLKRLKPKIIIVEEAAEVLEAHILSSLSSDVRHLISIGDHKQLKPSNAVWELATNFNLNLSLFERLINNEMSYVTLQYQHRMRPDISELIKLIYPTLIDHPVVLNSANVKGVNKNLFFIEHSFFEDKVEDNDTTSKTHTHEAEFIARLALHLLFQGYTENDITILTFYLGQQYLIRDCLKRELKKHNKDLMIRVSTVDRYQGEECKLILFSVVRSNKDNSIGYLKVDNRVCVALSRAKEGLFIIGNAKCLRKGSSRTKSNLWHKVLDILTSKNCINASLDLTCVRHPKNPIYVNCAADFDIKVPTGGCTLPCDIRMDCGHKCELFCHPYSHDEVLCYKLCERQKDCGHPCMKLGGQERNTCHTCRESCSPCNFLVEKTIEDCEHRCELACHLEPIRMNCQELCDRIFLCGHFCPGKCRDPCGDCNYLVEKTIQDCGHECKIACHLEPIRINCKELCDRTLLCGHLCLGKCRNPCEDLKCEVKVLKQLPCEHEAEIPCYSNPFISFKCNKPCLKLLDCNHPCPLKCYQKCDLRSCNFPCERSKECKHKCVDIHGKSKSCNEECGKCEALVEKSLPICGHTLNLPCHQEPEHELCKMECQKLLPCGHPCKLTCPMPCSNNCDVVVSKKYPCGHDNKIPCSADISNHPCDKSLLKELPCGHKLMCKCIKDPTNLKCNSSELILKKLPCGHSKQLLCNISVTSVCCVENCIRKLECGHLCRLKCNEECICLDSFPFWMRCESAKIFSPNNQLICGHKPKIEQNDPFNSLTYKCSQKCNCILNCGHNCTGDCNQCFQGFKHIPCVHKCNKNLPCGHRCNEICHLPEGCPPCKRKNKCPRKCKHKSCHHLCGIACKPCIEKCELGCKHSRCIKLCWEICDRIACKQKCYLILSCGHKCCGVCGEVCPSPCPKCLDTPQDGEELLYMIEDCKCVISLQGIDIYIENHEKSPLTFPRCPKCGKVIKQDSRMRSIIFPALQHYDKINSELICAARNNLQMQCEKLCKFDQRIECLSTIDTIKKEMCKYDAQKLFQIFTFLKILQLLLWHPIKFVKGCEYHKKFFDSNSLNDFIRSSIVHSGDVERIDHFHKAALRCRVSYIENLVKECIQPYQTVSFKDFQASIEIFNKESSTINIEKSDVQNLLTYITFLYKIMYRYGFNPNYNIPNICIIYPIMISNKDTKTSTAKLQISKKDKIEPSKIVRARKRSLDKSLTPNAKNIKLS